MSEPTFAQFKKHVSENRNCRVCQYWEQSEGKDCKHWVHKACVLLSASDDGSTAREDHTEAT